MSSLLKCCVAAVGSDTDDENDPALWSKELRCHYLGEFSMAVVQANQPVEDHSQVETFHSGTFVGVYDGHVDDVASGYVAQHLFPILISYVKDNPEGSVIQALRHAYLATDEAFMGEVDRACGGEPLMCATGSCCLVGFFWKNKVYIANAGDSKAVLGSLVSAAARSGFVATQLSEDHNASSSVVRQELTTQHPNDPNIVIHKNGAWRVKGIIQVTRTIGNAFLKLPGYELPAGYTRYQLPESPLQRAALVAEPAIREHTIMERDRFLIFASDGLWEHLSIHEAVDMVFRSPREGIASRLIQAAMEVAATKARSSYTSIKRMSRGDQRRRIHDDITVVVVFIDPEMIETVHDVSIQSTSFRGCDLPEGPSQFSTMDETDSDC